MRCAFLVAWVVLGPAALAPAQAPPRDFPFRDLTGRAEEFRFIRQWRSYYWREDFTFVLKGDDGKTYRIISREPTPWTNLRLGTTFPPGAKVDWEAKPRVRIVGVQGVDRIPVEFHDVKLDPAGTVTAFLVRVEAERGKPMRDYFVNNWFHRWGADTDRKVLPFYANANPHYGVYGYVGSNVAPFDAAGQALLAKHKDDYNGIIYHARVVKADNPLGHELKVVHLMGRHKKSLAYKVFHGDPAAIRKLDQAAPKKEAPRKAARRFTDVTAGSGLVTVKGSLPHAVAVADFDGDGLLDVLLTTFAKPHVQLFRNKGGLRFTDVTKASGLTTFDGTGSGAAVADFDRDGKLDVYLTSVRGGPSRLFRGRGDGTFEDVSVRSGTLLNVAARSCAWADVDGDGWPDLFVTCPDKGCRLFRNNRDGTFTDIAKKAGVDLTGRHALGCVFGDVDRDGKPDLFVTCYRSQVSALFLNRGDGTFRDATAASGLDRRASSVGCVLADVFNRGLPDLFVTTDSWLSGANYTAAQLRAQKHTVEPNVLYRNDGKGNFAPVADRVLAFEGLGHDAVLEDLDHDGQVEVVVTVDAESGNKWATSKGGNPLYTRVGGAWREVSKEWGTHHEANSVCVVAADLDNDGDLDLLVVNFYSNAVLLRNNTDDRRWLRVRAEGTKGPRDGIGAEVKAFREDGGKKVLLGSRIIQSGAGYCRCSPLEAHLGLGTDAGTFAVEVLFPSGKRVVRGGLRARQVVAVREE